MAKNSPGWWFLLVYAIAGGAAWGVIRAAAMAGPVAADVASILVIYTTIAARDLARHSTAVLRPLVEGDLAGPASVARIVGRDTEELDEAGIVRVAVESVAESTVDGVTAPLFFAIVAGPPAVWSTAPSTRSIRCSAIKTGVMPSSAGRRPGSTTRPTTFPPG